MRVQVINRAADAERWRAVAASFAAAAPAGWTLARVAAVEAEAAAGLPGRLRPAEKACFESHRRLVAGAGDNPGDLFVCEDDVAFAAQGLALVEAALAGDGGWDVLFTDIGVGDIADMIRLARLRRQLVAAGKVTLIDLAKATWFGSTAYVVRGRARAKLAGLLAAAALDAPYDITLRGLIRDGALAGKAMFPFVTTVSAEADRSGVQTTDGAGTDAVWNAFRRLMWIGRDLEAARHDAAAIAGRQDDAESAVLGTLIGAILDPGFRWK